MVSELLFAWDKEKYSFPLVSKPTIKLNLGYICFYGREFDKPGRVQPILLKSNFDSQDSSILITVFLLKSKLINFKANCYLKIRFLSLFAVKEMGLIFLYFIPRFSCIILTNLDSLIDMSWSHLKLWLIFLTEFKWSFRLNISTISWDMCSLCCSSLAFSSAISLRKRGFFLHFVTKFDTHGIEILCSLATSVTDLS